MTQYNETPTKVPCGIHTAELSGSVWRHLLSDVYVMLPCSAGGGGVITLQHGPETHRFPPCCADQTNRGADLWTIFNAEVITTGRSNLLSDQFGDWVCSLEVRAPSSWWTTIDWGNVAIQLQSLSIDFLQVQEWRAGRKRELDRGELPGYLLKYPDVFFSLFVVLTFSESKIYVYVDVSSAATLDTHFQQLQQLIQHHMWQTKGSMPGRSISKTVFDINQEARQARGKSTGKGDKSKYLLYENLLTTDHKSRTNASMNTF